MPIFSIFVYTPACYSYTRYYIFSAVVLLPVKIDTIMHDGPGACWQWGSIAGQDHANITKEKMFTHGENWLQPYIPKGHKNQEVVFNHL